MWKYVDESNNRWYKYANISSHRTKFFKLSSNNEILRNIIAERVLGLPQDPRADKGVAFKDIPSGNS